MSFHVPNQYRITTGPFGSQPALGNYGAFKVPVGTRYAHVIASEGAAWEHVSVSFSDRCPTWDEMCSVKAIFWDADDTVVQYHPPEAEYVHTHPFCLHLWRPIGVALPRPPAWMVGQPGGRVVQPAELRRGKRR